MENELSIKIVNYSQEGRSTVSVKLSGGTIEALGLISRARNELDIMEKSVFEKSDKKSEVVDV